ncbi:unnamed protein product [Cochlearia groenlandica]
MHIQVFLLREPNLYAPNNDSTPTHHGESPIRISTSVKTSPFFPFYTPSPARHHRNKCRDDIGGESKSVTSSPLRQLARVFTLRRRRNTYGMFCGGGRGKKRLLCP